MKNRPDEEFGELKEEFRIRKSEYNRTESATSAQKDGKSRKNIRLFSSIAAIAIGSAIIANGSVLKNEEPGGPPVTAAAAATAGETDVVIQTREPEPETLMKNLTDEEKQYILTLVEYIDNRDFAALYSFIESDREMYDRMVSVTAREALEYISLEYMTVTDQGDEKGIFLKRKDGEKPVIYCGNLVDGIESGEGIKVLFFQRSGNTFVNYYEGGWKDGAENGQGESYGYSFEEGFESGTGLKGSFDGGSLQGESQYYFRGGWYGYQVSNRKIVEMTEEFQNFFGTISDIEEEDSMNCYVDSYLFGE